MPLSIILGASRSLPWWAHLMSSAWQLTHRDLNIPQYMFLGSCGVNHRNSSCITEKIHWGLTMLTTMCFQFSMWMKNVCKWASTDQKVSAIDCRVSHPDLETRVTKGSCASSGSDHGFASLLVRHSSPLREILHLMHAAHLRLRLLLPQLLLDLLLATLLGMLARS